MVATSGNKPWRDKATLERLYVDERLSTREISEKLDCGRRTVTNWLYRLGVKEPSGNKPYHDAEQMENLYVEQEMSAEEIARMWGCSDMTVQRWVMRHGLSRPRVDPNEDAQWRDKEKLRELYFEEGLTHKEIGERLGCKQSTVTKWINEFDLQKERPTPWKDEETLKELYHEEGLTTEEIAEELDCSHSTISRWLDKFEGFSGSNNPWQDRTLMTNLYHKERMSHKEMAEELCCSESAIERWLEKLNIRTREEAPYTNPELLELLYVKKDLTAYEVSEELYCSYSAVARWLNRHDISKEESPDPWTEKDTLEEMYVEQEMSTMEIGEELGCHSSTVRDWLHRHDIDVRDFGGGGGPWQSKELLKRLYVKQEKSITEIGEELGCTHQTVSRWLAKHGIETRGSGKPHRVLDAEFTNYEDEPHRDRELLFQLYIQERKSISEIAHEFGVADSSVRVYLDKYGLLDEREDIHIDDLDYDVPEEEPWKDEELLRLLYVEHDVSTLQIAEWLGCVANTVITWLRKYDIEVDQRYHEKPSRVELRRLYHERGYSALRIGRELDVGRTTVYNWLKEYDIERKDSSDYVNSVVKDKERMTEMYVEREMSINEIADEIRSSEQTVKEWLMRHGISLRDPRKEVMGEKNPNWKGGQQPYGEGWTNQKREEVREKYDYLCQGCGISEEEYKEETGKRLDIHHIEKARRFSDEDALERNAIDNLVPMCGPCHQKWEGIPLKPPFLADD